MDTVLELDEGNGLEERPLDGRETNGLTADRIRLKEAVGGALAAPGTLKIAVWMCSILLALGGL